MNSQNLSDVKIEYSIEQKLKSNIDFQGNDSNVHSQVLRGHSICTTTNYCIGCFRNDSLYLNPVSHFLQFRPDFQNLEESKTVKSNREKHRERFNKNIKENQVPAEDWINLNFFDSKSMKSCILKENLFNDETLRNNNIENYQSNFVSKDEYLKNMFKNINNENISENFNENIQNKLEKKVTQTELKEYSFEKKLEYFMKKCHIVSFDFLMNLLDYKKEFTTEFYDAIEKICISLKSGTLILKSEVRFESKKNLILPRNQIINLLQNSEKGIEREKMNDQVKIQKDDMKEILSEIAINSLGKWYLKETKIDNNFITNHAKFYQNSLNFWEKLNQIQPNPNVQTTQIQDQIKSKLFELPQVKSQINPIINNNKNNNIEIVSNPIEEKIGNKFFDQMIRKHFDNNGCSTIIQLNEYCINDLNLSNYKDLLNLFLKDFCYKIKDNYYLKSINDSSIDPIRQVILEMFIEKSELKKNEITARLKEKKIKFTDNQVTKILGKIAIYVKPNWELRTSQKMDI